MGRRDRAARGCAALLAVLVGATAPSAASARPAGASQRAPASEERTARAPQDTARPAGASQQAPASASEVLADGPSTPAPPEVTPAERAAELAEPAIVEVDVRWQGYVFDRTTGVELDTQEVTASTRCAGAGIGSGGYLITTASCLNQTAVATDAFRQIVDRRVASGTITADQADSTLEDLLLTATIGTDTDNPSERTVTVRRAVTADEPMQATVVSVAKQGDGDVALLKINRSNQPILALAGDAVVGDDVVTMQLPADGTVLGGVAATTGTGDPSGTTRTAVQPTSRTGTVSGVNPHVLVTQSEPRDPATVLPGGIVVTRDAEVVGLVDMTLPDGDMLVPSDAIRDLLTAAEVDADLGPVDRDFRAGLDAYYAGRYTDSIESFDAVLAIIPSHIQAHDFRSRAQSLRQAAGGGPAPADSLLDKIRRLIRPPNSGWIVGVGVLVAIVLFFIRRRHPHATGEPDPVDDAPCADATAEVQSADETRRTTAGPVG